MAVAEEDANSHSDEGENSSADTDTNANLGGFGETGRRTFVLGGFASLFRFVCRRRLAGGFGRSAGDLGCGFGGWAGLNLGGIVSTEF